MSPRQQALVALFEAHPQGTNINGDPFSGWRRALYLSIDETRYTRGTLERYFPEIADEIEFIYTFFPKTEE